MADTKEQAETFDAELAKLRPEFTARLEKDEATASAEGKPLWAAALTSWRQLTLVHDKIIDAVRHDSRQQAHDLSMGPAKQLVTDTRADLGKIVDLNRRRLVDAEADAQNEYENARLLLIGIVVAATLIATATGAWIALSISRGMGRATDLAKAVAIGDLSQVVAVTSNDEIKDMVDALNQMTGNLRATAAVAN